jgi:hypothetical protein
VQPLLRYPGKVLFRSEKGRRLAACCPLLPEHLFLRKRLNCLQSTLALDGCELSFQSLEYSS